MVLCRKKKYYCVLSTQTLYFMQTDPNYLNPNSGVPAYADFGRRLVAYLIDVIIVGIPIGIIYGILITVLVGSAATGIDPNTGEMSAGAGMAMGGTFFLIYIVSPIIVILYFAYFESSEKQATIGKNVMGIKVVSLDGQRISFMNAIGRNAGRILSGMVCAIGYIMAAFTEKKQALHDMIASTLVVNK